MKNKLIYKQQKIWNKYCEKCKTFSTGNGSMVLPYQCECGIWKWDNYLEDFKLKKYKQKRRFFSKALTKNSEAKKIIEQMKNNYKKANSD